MASDKVNCVFCSQEGGKIIIFVQERLNKCKKILNRRVKFKLKYNNVKLPDNVNISDGYHRRCYSCFIALMAKYRNLPETDPSPITDLPSTSCSDFHETTLDHVAPIIDDNNSIIDINTKTEKIPETEDISTTKTSSNKYNRICFFCQKDCKLVKRKKQVVHSSNDAKLYEKIIKWMTKLKNDELLEKICNLKSSGETVFYHRLCGLMYGNSYKKSIADNPRTSWHATRDIHKTIFGKIKLLIEEEIIKNKNCILLSSLYDLYNQDLERELKLQSLPDLSLITKHYLEKKILKHFKTKIKISTNHRKKIIMPKNSSLLQDEDLTKPNENDLIDKAAFTVRSTIGSASTSARREILRESHRKANSSRQGTDKEENLTLLSLLIDSKREEDHCSLLPEEISESGAEGLSSGSDPFDVEVTQHPKSVCFSPSSSAEVYNTGFPSCLSSSDNWHQRNESEVETSFLSNSPQLPGVINDACTKFFLSMSDTVRDLPPDLQIMAKRNVLHAVTECELTALNRLNMPKN